MAERIIQEETLTSIGDAIREKTGGSTLIDPLDMPAAIRSISGQNEIISESSIIAEVTTAGFATFTLNKSIKELVNFVLSVDSPSYSYVVGIMTLESGSKESNKCVKKYTSSSNGTAGSIIEESQELIPSGFITFSGNTLTIGRDNTAMKSFFQVGCTACLSVMYHSL